MKGSLRMLLGFLLVASAVGADDAAPISAILWYAFFGLLIMWWGVQAMKTVDNSAK
jgi:hypothetical protein